MSINKALKQKLITALPFMLTVLAIFFFSTKTLLLILYVPLFIVMCLIVLVFVVDTCTRRKS